MYQGRLLIRLMTQNETWVYLYDLEAEAQSKQWKRYDRPPPKKSSAQPSAGKTLLTVISNQCGVVMVAFFAKGINSWDIPCFTYFARDPNYS